MAARAGVSLSEMMTFPLPAVVAYLEGCQKRKDDSFVLMTLQSTRILQALGSKQELNDFLPEHLKIARDDHSGTITDDEALAAKARIKRNLARFGEK